MMTLIEHPHQENPRLFPVENGNGECMTFEQAFDEVKTCILELKERTRYLEWERDMWRDRARKAEALLLEKGE